MSNLLIIEDNPRIARSLEKELKPHFTNIFRASTYESALDIALSDIPDIILVDVELGEERTGLDICNQVRLAGKNTPLLVVTALPFEDSFEQTFKLGYSDYIAKPYHPEEIRIRLKNLLAIAERVRERKINKQHKVSSDFVVDFNKSTVIIDGKEKHVPKTLKYLLQLFIDNPNEILSHKFLQEKIWGDYFDIDKKREIRSHTKRLRALLGEHYGKKLVNVKSQGYMFKL